MTSRELFDQAIGTVLKHEGDRYTEDPHDPGGATKYGISAHYNPGVDVKNLTREQAVEIYWHKYWDGRHYEELPHDVAIKIFDLAVNLGEGNAIVCLQRALWACSLPVKADGKLGPVTIEAATRANRAALMAALRSEAAGEYRLRVARRAEAAGYEAGWLNRAYT